MKVKKMLGALLALICITCFCMTPVTVQAYNEIVEITEEDQVVDSYRGVDALYRPNAYETTLPYNCAGYVRSFYQEIYGVNVTNLFCGQTPNGNKDGQAVGFVRVKSPQAGDICGEVKLAKGTNHWTIVRKVQGDTIVVIEQNYKWTGADGKIYCQVNRQIPYKEAGDYRFYRLESKTDANEIYVEGIVTPEQDKTAKSENKTEIKKATTKASTAKATEKTTEKATTKASTAKATEKTTEKAATKASTAKATEKTTEKAATKASTAKATEKTTEKATTKASTAKATEKTTEKAATKASTAKATEKTTEKAATKVSTAKVTAKPTAKTSATKVTAKPTTKVSIAKPTEKPTEKATVEAAAKKGIQSIISNISELAVHRKAQFHLQVTYEQSGKTVKDVTYRSEDPTIAKVNKEGIVSAVSSGKTRIIMTVGDAETACTVTVYERPQTAEVVEITAKEGKS
ncbi:MAG: Ig-like domain-containing protein [Lachnospiraceae bacterium]